MKKLIIMLIVALVTFTGCYSNNSSELENTETIIDNRSIYDPIYTTNNIEQVEKNQYSSNSNKINNILGVWSTNSTDGTKMLFYFEDNNMAKIAYYGFGMSLVGEIDYTYEINGTHLIMESVESDLSLMEIIECDFEINGDKLIMSNVEVDGHSDSSDVLERVNLSYSEAKADLK